MEYGPTRTCERCGSSGFISDSLEFTVAPPGLLVASLQPSSLW